MHWTATGLLALVCSCDAPPSTWAGDVSAPGQQLSQSLSHDRADLDFVLTQIEISEAHSAGASLNELVQSPLLPFGMRTVDGSFNNLLPGQELFGAGTQVFPRLLPPVFRAADGGTSYAQTSGSVFDAQPRIASNLIVDQSVNNPAAVAAAAQTDGSIADVDDEGSFFIPNVAPDVGLSAPYNSWFTLFGQFFDHGLDLVERGGSGTVFVPLQEDDPLFRPGASTNFMVLSRATNRRGPDGLLGTDDDVHEHLSKTTAFVDQNQTYTSHPSHQVFLRKYVVSPEGKPVATGEMLDGARGGLATWEETKAQASALLGIALSDADVLAVPLLATDEYGKFFLGAAGFPLLVTPTGLVEGNPLAPVSPTAVGALLTGHAFLDDIAHGAAPLPGLSPDANGVAGGPPPATGTYDDELLAQHRITGDGRGNENIGLTAVHSIFHAEHNRLVQHVKDVVLASGSPDFIASWLLPGAVQGDGVQDLEWNGERLFQAARFTTEMQYQHLVFEEFARKVQVEVNVFSGYDSNVDPAIMAEFAHTVYRFGHSMLTESMARTNADGSLADIGLIEAFLNPLAFTASGPSDLEATGAIIRGMTRQQGNEIDEFVTGALRSNLLGLPLDLPTINMVRARDTGVPSLNTARRMFFADTGNSALQPYQSWADFSFALRHPESLANFIAAYGTHPTVIGATTFAAKRAAATAIVTGGAVAPGDSADFLNSTGSWAGEETGLDLVDFWVGGLAEKQMVFGGLLGPTFNYVFETQMERLQDGDRFYYLSRTVGLNFLTQLEQNSFAEIVMRNTDVQHLPGDIFSLPAFTFELANLGTSGPILDDAATPDDEAALLIRTPDGTVRYPGVEHVVFGGTPGDDRMRGSEGDDTFWGDEGNDRIEGGDGNDRINGGDGDDIITDLFGVDNIKGGGGDDVINAGQGLGDLILGGDGNDFVVAGADPKETFGGSGNDYINAGDSFDVVFGGEGDDWIEGGDQADLLQGDNGEPFQASPIVGNDVIIGGGGNDDYDSESGDDIMVSDSGTERHEGMLGFDWVTYKGDSQPANADMFFTGLQPPSLDAIRDRFDLVEGLSGWDHDDVLRGTRLTTVEIAAIAPDSAGQNNALNTPAQIALIDGLQELLGPGVTSFSGGEIVLGGGGSDIMEGRGGADIIDGDRWLNVRLSVVDSGGAQIATADTMGGLLLEKTGALAGTPETLTLQEAMFAGTLSPGQLRIIREILTEPAGAAIDTAVFSDVLANYEVTPNGDGSLSVAHTGGTQSDGVDRVFNIERLQFADGTFDADDLSTSGDPLLPVAGLTAVASDGAVFLSFVLEPGTTGSRILRSTVDFAVSPEDTVDQVVIVDGGGDNHVDAPLQNGVTYFYTVYAYDEYGGSYAEGVMIAATPNAPTGEGEWEPGEGEGEPGEGEPGQGPGNGPGAPGGCASAPLAPNTFALLGLLFALRRWRRSH